MSTRTDLQRVATHVLARQRFATTGRFGLRPGPGGVATPLFGEDVLRTSGSLLIHEAGGDVRTTDLDGASLREVAELTGADLTAPFACGADTPALGDLDAPLRIDDDEARGLGDWWALGVAAIDRLAAPEQTTVQIWPEHFDAGCSVATPTGRCNLGASPGDGFSEEPYLYVGPWLTRDPDDFWNAPFGAVLLRSEASPSRAVAFLREGLRRLSR